MKQQEQILISLIKQSFFGIREKIPLEGDWNAVLHEAQQQTVVGLAAAVLPEGIPQEAYSKWRIAEYQQLAQQVRYWDAQDQLHSLLTANGISYAILKGASAAMLYPSPFRRAMGDIDFLVLPEQFVQTKEILLANGYAPEGEPSYRHIGFSRNGISFELHQQFSYSDLDMEERLLSGLTHAELQTVDGHPFYSLPPIENGLVLLGHLWDHLHTGVGLRQVIDWMLYVYQYLDEEAWNSGFSVQAEKLGLKKLAVHATHMCWMYLGLPSSQPWYDKADEELCSELFAKVLHDGNFGRKKSNMYLNDRKTRTALSGMSRHGFFRHLQSRGEVNWTLYHRHPWLRPFAWIYQLFRYPVLWLRSKKEKKLFAFIKDENETHTLLKKLS